jgi:hypothetical protein
MSYHSLIDQAVSYWPFQGVASPAVDVIGGQALHASGPVVFGGAGPRPWLPFSVAVGELNSVQRFFVAYNYPGLNGLFGYTIAFWVRLGVSSARTPFFNQYTANVVRLGIDASDLMWVSNDSVTVGQSAVNVTPGSWHMLSYRRSASGIVRRLGCDGVFESGATQPNTFNTGAIFVGYLGLSYEVAGLGVWPRYLSDGEVQVLEAGIDYDPSDSRRRRGSGKARRPG